MTASGDLEIAAVSIELPFLYMIHCAVPLQRQVSDRKVSVVRNHKIQTSQSYLPKAASPVLREPAEERQFSSQKPK